MIFLRVQGGKLKAGKTMRRFVSIIPGLLILLAAAAGASAGEYVWHNVKIGGGGYIPNIVFSPVERGLAFLRSDMGGVYRWDEKTAAWAALQDGDADFNRRGVESVAPDPKDANTVYAAVGAYRKFPAAIIRSSDKGDHWDIVPVPFRMGGNEEGRDAGERLAVDPNDTSILYFASRYDGLQKSTDKGKTWAPVAGFPLKGLGVPADRERPHAGLSFVLFDSKSGSPSQTIYAGNADPGEHHLYRSLDGGASWAPVPGEPGAKLLPLQAALDASGVLYVAYADNLGPWGVTGGALYKLDTHTGVWTDITPDASHPAYAGLSIDARAPGTLAAATLYRAGGDTVWRTADGGATWQSLKEISRRDVAETPFLLWGNAEAEFGWWITGLAIDPFDSTHIAYTTGATVYATHDLGKNAMQWRPWVNGVEQTAILAMTSPPTGPHLLSGIGDIGGYTHFDLAVSPPIQENPIFTNSDTVDYAGRAPSIVVRSGTHKPHPKTGARTASLAWSQDFGRTWQPLFAPLPQGYRLPDPMPYNYGDPYVDAAIKVSADGKTFIVMTPDAPSITRSRGAHWTHVKGLPAGASVVADRVDGHVFFAVDYAHHRFYLSVDGGFRFRPAGSSGLPPDISGDDPAHRRDIESPVREIALPLLATPGKRGDLWFVSKGRLFHSRDNGKTFAAAPGDLSVAMLSFGKAPAGRSYPALFAIGHKGGPNAIWRSDDAGRNWIRVNDGDHQYFGAFRCIAGDPRVFGRVYAGTDGRGIVYGEPGE
jgi:xyloglucan-specific exo-beta-1,4-glucanase